MRAHQKISSTAGGFTGTLGRVGFGFSVAPLGDLDQDGAPDLLVGAPGDQDVDGPGGTAWVLFLRPDGSVRAHQKIGASQGGFSGPLSSGDSFGSSACLLGDLDGDGLADLAIGAREGDSGSVETERFGTTRSSALSRAAFPTPSRTGSTSRIASAPRSQLSATSTGTESSTSRSAHLGTVLDSRPDGPNRSGLERDLLVGRGNVLIFQNSNAPMQRVPGVFAHPVDDPDGGTLLFCFARGQVQIVSLDLIDIDGGARQSAQVTLIDRSGARRTYVVPSGWTEDLVADGPPAFRTLDLGCLEPQPGHASVALATEDPGFDPREVDRMEVQLTGTGAIDEPRWIPHPSTRARSSTPSPRR